MFNHPEMLAKARTEPDFLASGKTNPEGGFILNDEEDLLADAERDDDEKGTPAPAK